MIYVTDENGFFIDSDLIYINENCDIIQDIDAIEVRQVRHVDDCSVCHIGFLTAQNESDTSLYKDCQNCNVSDELIEGVAMTEILKEIEDDIWGTESSHLF